MKYVVNWIPLRIRVRSRNTQPHLKQYLLQNGPDLLRNIRNCLFQVVSTGLVLFDFCLFRSVLGTSSQQTCRDNLFITVACVVQRESIPVGCGNFVSLNNWKLMFLVSKNVAVHGVNSATWKSRREQGPYCVYVCVCMRACTCIRTDWKEDLSRIRPLATLIFVANKLIKTRFSLHRFNVGKEHHDWTRHLLYFSANWKIRTCAWHDFYI